MGRSKRRCPSRHSPITTTKPSFLCAVWGFLNIFEPLPSTSLDDDAQKASRRDISATPPARRLLLTRYWENQYKESHDDLANVRSRAANLLAAAGIVSGVLTLVVGTWFGALLHFNSLVNILVSIVALAMIATILWTAFASIYLSVRAQEAHEWWLAEVRLDRKSTEKDYEIEYAYQLDMGARGNKERVSAYSKCLKDAQWYFRFMMGALIFLIVLAILSSLLGFVQFPSASQR